MFWPGCSEPPPEYPEESTLSERVEVISAALAKSALLAKIKREVKDEIIKPRYTPASLAQQLPQLMEQMGATVRITNHVHQLHLQAQGGLCPPDKRRGSRPSVPRYVPGGHAPAVQPPMPANDEQNDVIGDLRRRWRQLLIERLQRLSRELDVPFARLRTAQTESLRRVRDATTERRRLSHRATLSLSQLNQLETDEGTADSDVEPQTTSSFCEQAAFNAVDLLDHFAGVSNPNHTSSVTRVTGWGLVALELPVPSIDTLCARYADVDPRNRQFGVDEGLRDWFNDERIRIGSLLLQKGSLPDLRAFARRGIPVSLRKDFWRRLLGLSNDAPLKDKESAHLAMLQQDVGRVELLVDEIVRWDIRLCSNDDKYFVFDEQLEKVLVPLVRDRQCLAHTEQAVHRINAQTRDGTSVTPYPPSGIVPHDGLATLCAPLCFLYPDVGDVYTCFRAFLCKHWIKLQTLSSAPGTVVSLARLFERLVQGTNPDVVYHCLSIGVRPLRIAFPWMFNAFAGFLEVDQIFHLWDRILAYDSLELVAVLAASIFLWRSRGLLQCTTEDDVQRLFTDFTKIQVIPLLQHFLFA